MKTTIITLLTILLIPFAFINPQGPYGFESAYVEMWSTTNTSGIEIKTFKEMHITGHGNYITTYTTEWRNIPMANIVDSSKSVHIVCGNEIIYYDPVTREGTKTKSDLAATFKGMSKEDQKKIAEGMMEGTNTKITDGGTGEVAGKPCTITIAETNMMGFKMIVETWYYKNFVMKNKSKEPNVDEYVTVFNEGVEIDPNKTSVPPDVNIKETQY